MSDGSWNRIYCGRPPEPPEIWSNWNFDPPLLVALAILALVVGRDPRGLAAVTVLFIAFVSPLCALSSALFSARVVHHVLLTVVAAQLIGWYLPSRKARSVMLPFAVSTLVFWFWHAPAPYDRALSHIGIYWLMQITLLASAVWFWREVSARNRSPVEALTFIVMGFAQMGMLGAVLTFAPQPMYAAHAIAPFAWQLSPLADQQIGGLIMWVPAGVLYALAAIFLLPRPWSKAGDEIT
ncbi:MAG: cytochrome c oxidase assembly protein [Rhizobiaceae bacterium]|nr:cytochrome c oxidase assembly protein [Rhizobiaceae bacterium]